MESINYRLSYMLKQYWKRANLSIEDKNKLVGLSSCGCRTNTALTSNNVLIIADDHNETEICGVTFCHSIWACPRCTAKAMAVKSTRIAAGIEALKNWHNEWAVMMTLTIPHCFGMSCADTYQILRDAWRHFTRARSSKTKKHTRKDGTEANYKISRGAWSNLCENLHVQHNVRVFEFTWGENSWHPHIHMLFWTPRHLFNRIQEFEKPLQESWQHSITLAVKKYLAKKPKDFDSSYYQKWLDGKLTGPILTISKDKHGKPRRQESSYYLCGWSADREMNLSLKRANPGHYTPEQLLEEAYELRKTDPKLSEMFLRKFTEYALATFKTRRTNFTTKLNRIINNWMATEEYAISFKKKGMAVATRKWRIVCWFRKESWYDVLARERNHNESIVAQILELAADPNGKTLITALLENLGCATPETKNYPDEAEILEILNGNVDDNLNAYRRRVLRQSSPNSRIAVAV